MRKFSDVVLDQANGRPVSGATITVRVANASPGTGALATIYSDDGISPITGSFVLTDSAGRYSFYASDGRYDFTVTGTNITTQTVGDLGEGGIALISPVLTTPILGVATGTSLALTGGLTVGSGTQVLKILETSFAYDFPSIAANTCADSTGQTLTGASDGDIAIVGVQAAIASTAGLQFSAFVSSANTVKVRCCNVTTGAIDPGNAGYRVTVIQF